MIEICVPNYSILITNKMYLLIGKNMKKNIILGE